MNQNALAFYLAAIIVALLYLLNLSNLSIVAIVVIYYTLLED